MVGRGSASASAVAPAPPGCGSRMRFAAACLEDECAGNTGAPARRVRWRHAPIWEVTSSHQGIELRGWERFEAIHVPHGGIEPSPRGYLDRDRADSFSRRGGVSQFRLTVPQVCSSRATCEIIEAMSIEPASAIEAMSIEPVTAAVFDRWIVGVVGGITAFYGALHARWSFDFKALQPGTTRRPRVSLSTKGVRGTSFFIPFRHLGSLCFPTRRFLISSS